jgi:ATP-dependent helicase/nuclease subunit A
MPDETLTPEQQEAVETLEADLLVSASAGTGKTRVLTRRFSYIVEHKRAAVDQILTLTFTDKAAHEMKKLIAKRFRDIGREDERRQVETAYISTVHSFCARLLRENAIEAGVDPYFTQLDEPEAAIIQRRVFADLVRQAYTADDAAVIGLVSEFGVGNLREMLFSVYGRMRSLGMAPQDLLIPPPPDLDAAAHQAGAAVDAAARLQGSTAAIRGLLDELRAARPRIDDLLAVREFNWDCHEAVNEFARICRGNVGSANEKPVIGAAKQALQSFAAALLSHHAANRARALRDLLAAFLTAYGEAKDEEGQLDFDDLLSKARDLFGTPGEPTPTALRYRDRFKFFLMDEFQDTNRLQMSVALPLLRPHASFTVGDAKQSIYRFLYADVDVFLEREKRIEERGGIRKELSENFRSHPQLLNFTNAFFRELWSGDDMRFGGVSPGKQFGKREGPRVEVFAIAGAENARDRREQEAQMIARRICEMTGASGGAPMMLTEKGKEHPAGFKDILILSRATSDIQIYEDALRECNVPYYTVSGRGFYDTQEVRDLSSLLAAIENSSHDIALAAVLRSPLVGISDEALYWLGAPQEHAERDEDSSQPRGTGRIAYRLEHLEGVTQLSPQDRERLIAFRDLFHSLRQTAADRSIPDLLDAAIRGTEYDLKVLCQRNGRRRYANIEKLREVALAFQERSSFSLREFLDYLESLQLLAERETEAATEAEEADVVRLMTVHAAKGLEAPIVIVADLARKQRLSAESAVLSGSGELAVKVRNPLSDELVPAPDHVRLSEAASAADFAEFKRLFYVACTRAKEHLILSGCAVGESAADSEDAGDETTDAPTKRFGDLKTWAEWVTTFLGVTRAPGPEGEVVKRDDFSVLVRSEVSAPPQVADRPSAPLLARFRARIAAKEPLEVSPVAAGCDTDEFCREAQAVARRIASTAAATFAHPGVSVTGAMRYRRCPRLFRLSLIERLPEEGFGGEPEDNPAAEPDDEDPRDRGTRLHDLLSQVDVSDDFDRELERLTRDLDEIHREDATEVLRRFRDSPMWREVAQADEVLRETPFVVRLDDGMVRGQIDVLARRGDRWTLVDYKSGRQRHDDEYRGQLELYALACRELLGVTPARAVIYYLDLGETKEFPIDNAALDKTAADLSAVLRGIAACEFPRAEGATCASCAFAAACRSDIAGG